MCLVKTLRYPLTCQIERVGSQCLWGQIYQGLNCVMYGPSAKPLHLPGSLNCLVEHPSSNQCWRRRWPCSSSLPCQWGLETHSPFPSERSPSGELYCLLLCLGFASFSGCGKESTYLCRRLRRCGFNPWVGMISWRSEWHPTPGFLPGESQGQRSLAGYSPWGRVEWDITE